MKSLYYSALILLLSGSFLTACAEDKAAAEPKLAEATTSLNAEPATQKVANPEPEKTTEATETDTEKPVKKKPDAQEEDREPDCE